MDARQERGLALSRDKRIRNVNGPTWAVPSQSENVRAYLVNAQQGTCTCPDYELRRTKCKHVFAVEFARSEFPPPSACAHCGCLGHAPAKN